MATRRDAVELLRSARYGVLATTHPDGSPLAAVVGVAVTDALELVLDTARSSRKHANLTWLRIRPGWVRVSDFATDPPRVDLVAL